MPPFYHNCYSFVGGVLSTDKEVPVMGIQVVIAARPEGTEQTQQAVKKELARLRELEMQAGKRALGPQHEARVLALEEKADRQGFDVMIRLVAVESEAGSGSGARAEAHLAALFRKYRQFDRSIAGVKQGFQVVRRERVGMRVANQLTSSPPMISPESLWRAGPVLGRWPREGVCLPRLLPFMKIGKSCVLNMTELSAVYHFPHQGLENVAALRWGTYRQIPAPAEAYVTAEQVAEGRNVMLGAQDNDLLPIETAPPARTRTPIQTSKPRPMPQGTQVAQREGEGKGANVLPPGLRSVQGVRGVGTRFEDLRRGSYVFGPMGSGKSVLLYNIIVQHMAARRGVGLLDGKGDSYEEVLRLVPPHLEGEVLTFDPENRSKGDKGGKGGSVGGRSIGINPLDGRVAAQLGVERVEALTMSLMKKMMGANWEQAILMQRFLRDGITAVLQVEPAPTMLNLWRWLQDDGKGGNEYRDALVGKIRNKLVQDFWQRQVPTMSSQHRSSMQNVLTRVDRYVKNEVRYLLLQPYSTVNFQAIMDRGTIFVGRVSPRLGEDQSFLGALVLNGFLAGAFARQSIPQEQRRDYLLVVDEFQNFVDTARADVERMLSMARGYRLGLMLAHQYTDQVPKEVLSAILKNVQTWVVFGLQADDARRFAEYMNVVEAEDFQNLPPYYTYQRAIVDNMQTGVYSAAPLPLPIPAENPGARRVSNQESERKEKAMLEMAEMNREVLRSVRAPERIVKLARGEPEESENASRTRILKLARELYGPAEEGNPDAIKILSTLSDGDRELYRRARRNVLDKEEREVILAHPQLIRDKAERIERLSALRWGTPRAEVEALILATVRSRVVGAEAPSSSAPGGAVGPARTAAERHTEKFSLSPELTELDEQHHREYEQADDQMASEA
ncbi:MAG: TraM recognition domain-containing protein [Chloroflexia bacterium]